MIVHYGRSGSVRWSIDDEGLMLFEPVDGNEGTLANSQYRKSEQCFAREWREYRISIKKIKAIGKIYLPENSINMFGGCVKLTSIDLSHFDTSEVVKAQYMFYACSSLTALNVSNFDTSKIADMSCMFSDCFSLTSLDVSNFDTSNVTNMRSMFRDCSALTSLDLSNFDTSNVADIDFMFSGCYSLTSLDISNFDLTNATDLCRMFQDCDKLVNLDLSGLKSLAGKNTFCIFERCESLSNLVLCDDVEKATDSLVIPYTILDYVPDFCLLHDQRIKIASVIIRYVEEWLNTDLSKEKEELKTIKKENGINGISVWKSKAHPIKKVKDMLEILRKHGVLLSEVYKPQFLTEKGVVSDINAYLSGVPVDDILA